MLVSPKRILLCFRVWLANKLPSNTQAPKLCSSKLQGNCLSGNHSKKDIYYTWHMFCLLKFRAALCKKSFVSWAYQQLWGKRKDNILNFHYQRFAYLFKSGSGKACDITRNNLQHLPRQYVLTITKDSITVLDLLGFKCLWG